MTTKKKEQEQILVYVDERQISQTKKLIEAGQTKLNHMKGMVDDLINDLTDEQIRLLPIKCVDVIREHLRSKYQFPKADDDFNLQTMGINPKPIYDYFQKNYQSWITYNFEFKDHVFYPTETQKEIEKHYHYAKTPEQIFVYNKLNEVIVLVKELKEIGIVRNDLHLKEMVIPGMIKSEGNRLDGKLTTDHERAYQWLDAIKNGRYIINMPN